MATVRRGLLGLALPRLWALGMGLGLCFGQGGQGWGVALPGGAAHHVGHLPGGAALNALPAPGHIRISDLGLAIKVPEGETIRGRIGCMGERGGCSGGSVS